MPLDFNSDITRHAKLASGMGDYFPSAYPVGGMRASEFRQLQDNYARNIAPLEDRSITMQNNMMQLQSQDLAYKNAQLAYEQKKEALRLQSEYNDPAILNRIDEVLAGDASALEQRDQIQEIGRANPQALINVPLIGQAYQTALNQTKTRAEQEAKEAAPEKATKATLSNRLLQMSTPEANIAGVQLLRDEITIEDALVVISDQLKEALAASKQEKRFDKKALLLKEDVAFLKTPKTDTAPSFKETLETLGGTDITEWDNLIADDSTTEEEKMAFMLKYQQPVKFDRVYRNNLITLLDNRTDLTEKEIREQFPASNPKSDMLLYRAAQEAVEFGRAEIVGVRGIEDLYSTPAEREVSEAMPIPSE